MKTISKIMLTALSLALVACGTFGGGDTDMSNDPIFQQFKKANINFVRARQYAADCVGKDKEAQEFQSLGDSLELEKNLSKLAEVNKNMSDGENKQISFDSSKKLSDDAKQKFKTSAKFFFKGVASESALAVVLAQKVKEMQEQIQNASPMEKMSLASKLTPYADMLQMVQNDVANAAVTSKLYIDYGISQGIDMADEQNKALEEMQGDRAAFENNRK